MICSRKGSVSKNTATVNLAYELSQLNKRVLILNFDGQGDTTKNSVKNGFWEWKLVILDNNEAINNNYQKRTLLITKEHHKYKAVLCGTNP